MDLFIDRDEELNFLNQHYAQTKAQFIVIYGRRRVGKSELVKQFIKDKEAIYFLPTKTTAPHHLQRFLEKIAFHFKNYTPQITSWEDGFKYFLQRIDSQERLVLVIDEFPYLIEANPEIPSLFQLFWDEYLKDRNLFLIILGSSVSMMETEVLGQKSPLYGRRTGQIRLLPFKFKDAALFYPSLPIEKIIELYAVVGNIPMYLLEFDPHKSLIQNIQDKILAQKELLYEETNFLLKEELRNPATYQAILEAIAGSTTATEIANKAQVELHNLDKYLKVLLRLDLIYKETPVTIEKPKSRKVNYFLKDNFFCFWYRFCFPNISLLEENPGVLLNQIIQPQLNSYIGKKFEQVCKEYLWQQNQDGKRSFLFTKLGREWGKIPGAADHQNQYEIDLCAINPKNKEILFGECKWQKEVDPVAQLHLLRDKVAAVGWNKGQRKEHFILFAKSFRDKNKVNIKTTDDCSLIDLQDLENWIRKKRE